MFRIQYLHIKIMLLFVLLKSTSYSVAQTNNLSWPFPTGNAHIKFSKCIKNPANFGIKKNIWKKLKHKVIGADIRMQFIKAQGLALSNDGSLAFAETDDNRIQIYNIKKNSVKIIEIINKEKLLSPINIEFDNKNNIYICDSELKKIFVLNQEYKLIAQYGDNNEFMRPTGIAVNNNKNELYIVDTAQNCVFICDLNGAIKSKFGKRGSKTGEFNYPTYICVDKENKIYISDTFNFRIQVFDEYGQLLFSFGEAGTTDSTFTQPKGIAVDNMQNIYVVDALSCCFKVFNSKGKLLTIIGENGTEKAQFSIPADIAISNNNDIFITDYYNERIQVFNISSQKQMGNP